jgi:cAMP phosphodiesterase
MRAVGAEPAIGEEPQFLTTFLINGRVAIDAGSIGFAPLAVQQPVEHLFVSHSHIDHIASLPMFLENVYEPNDSAVTVYAADSVLDCLQKDMFNERLWPDFIGLSEKYPPFLRTRSVSSGETIDTGGLRVTPIAVDHVVETFGFIVEDDNSAIVIASDTAPTERIWAEAAKRSDLCAVFLECSFPMSLEWLAEQALHLTPVKYAAEIRKIGRPIRNVAMHIKPGSRATVVEELAAQQLEQLEIGEPGRLYDFPER